jgi:hypothetical protein
MWGLFELVKNPDLQNTVRAEIRSQERKKRTRDEAHWMAKDFDEMPYVSAVVKVSLLACESVKKLTQSRKL